MPSSVPVISNRIDQDLINAYRKGRSTPPRATAAMNGSLFQKLLSDAIRLNCTCEEISSFSDVQRRKGKALKLARAGKVESAQQLTQACRSLIEGQSSPIVQRLSSSFISAVEAYIEFRLHNFCGARSHIVDAITSDILLETDHGLSILQSHRIQLTFNLIRVHARLGSTVDAFHLANDLLNYLYGQSDDVARLREWVSRPLDGIPNELIYAHKVEICSELACMLHAEGNKQIGLQCLSFWRNAHGSSSEDRRILRWFRAKHAFLSKQFGLFNNIAAEYLLNGLDSAPMLWYAMVLDLASDCKTRVGGSEFGTIVLQDIKSFPPEIVRRFSHSRLPESPM